MSTLLNLFKSLLLDSNYLCWWIGYDGVFCNLVLLHCCFFCWSVQLYMSKAYQKPISSKRSSGVQINIGFFRDSCSKLSEVRDM